MTRRGSNTRSLESSSELSFYSFHSPKTRASAAESSPLRFIEVDDDHSPTTMASYSFSRNSFTRAAEMSSASIRDPPSSPISPKSPPVVIVSPQVTVQITNFAGHLLNPLTYCYPQRADLSPLPMAGYLLVCCGSEQISKAKSLTFDPNTSIIHDQNGIGGCVVSPADVLSRLIVMCNHAGIRHDLEQNFRYHSSSVRGSPTHSHSQVNSRSWQRLYEDARLSKARKDFKSEMLQEHRRQQDEDHRTVVNRRVSLSASPGMRKIEDEFAAAGIPFQRHIAKKRYHYLRKTGTAVDYNDAFKDSYDVDILAGNPEAEAILFDDGLTEVWPRNLLYRCNKREAGTCFNRLYQDRKVPIVRKPSATPADMTKRESRKKSFYENLSRHATSSSAAKQHGDAEMTENASSVRSPSPEKRAASTRNEFYYNLAKPRAKDSVS